MTKTDIKKYKERWSNEKERIDAIINAIKNNQNWTKYLISHPDHNFKDLAFVNEGFEDDRFKGTDTNRDLRGVTLEDLNLQGTTVLSGTCLDYSSLKNINLNKSTINATSYYKTKIESVSFEEANVKNCNLANANIKNINCAFGALDLIDLKNSKISGCNFIDSELNDINFNTEKTFSFCFREKNCRKIGTKIFNIKHNLSQIKSIEPDFMNFLKEQKRSEEIKKMTPIFWWIFYISSNCGTSFKRLGFWLICICSFFALLYSISPLPVVCFEEGLNIRQEAVYPDIWYLPVIDWGPDYNENRNIFLPVYFSVVTLTTLGYGDIHPLNTFAQVVCSVEAIFGYFILGMLSSIILNYMWIREE